MLLPASRLRPKRRPNGIATGPFGGQISVNPGTSRLANLVRTEYRRAAGHNLRSTERSLHDPCSDFRLIHVDGKPYVLKRRSAAVAHGEHYRALEAWRLVDGLVLPDLGVITAVVPTTVSLEGSSYVLVTPYLGPSLASDLASTAAFLPRGRLIGLLSALLDRGVEFSGCVPRNLFVTGDGLALSTGRTRASGQGQRQQPP